jgi:biotin transport system substrate-specific component
MKMVSIGYEGSRTLLQKNVWRQVLQVLAASLFIGLCAQIKIPLFFTPVPLTGQTFAVLLVGSLLGSRKGALAALCYLAEGSMGMPVWAGGAAGIAHLLGPTGGYRFAYPLQALLAGYFFKKLDGTFLKLFTALFMTCCMQLAVGSLWLGLFVGFTHCFALGFLPFITIELFKTLMLTCPYAKPRSWHHRLRS